MLVYCANPACYTPLHSFSDGRLFQFEVVSISLSASDDAAEPFDEKPERQTAQFWLCGHCAATMSLILDPQQGLRLIPFGSNETDVSAQSGLQEGEFRQSNSC